MRTHDEIVASAIKAVRSVNRDDIIRAFIGSLSTRNLPARSAFGSYVVLQNLEAHAFQSASWGQCMICGERSETDRVETDERVANYPFQIHHTEIIYAAFDLQTFATRAVDEPTQESISRLKRLLDALRALPAEAQLTQLVKSIGHAITSNKHQRMMLLETFGYAGILCPNDQDHYTMSFVSARARRQPANFFKREWAYPVCFWTGLDGVNEDLVTYYFGPFLEGSTTGQDQAMQ